MSIRECNDMDTDNNIKAQSQLFLKFEFLLMKAIQELNKKV